MNFSWQLLASVLMFGLTVFSARANSTECDQPEPVCAARAAVFSISAFDPTGSATRISERLLVTSRHVVADETDVIVRLPNNQNVKARVVPSGYLGDLILLESDALPIGNVLQTGEHFKDMQVYTVGVDLGRRRVRAYPPGTIKFQPAIDFPYARLHHNAHSQPGNSGGALVDVSGRLVGIITSGGEGRFEAIPALEIAHLKVLSGNGFETASQDIGTAVRVCTLKIEEVQREPARSLGDQDVNTISTSCRRSGNRQLYDLAGQVLGRVGRFDGSIKILNAAIAQDPNAINSRISLIISQNITGRYEESLPHIRWLLDHKVDDLQVLRFGIQSGVWGGGTGLAERAYNRLKKINPKAAPNARRFLDAPPVRPKRR